MRAVSALAALVWATATASPVAAQALQPEELFDAAIGDWNRDGRSDLAILVQSDTAERDTSLFIYLREDAEDGVLELVFSAEDMLWGSGGSMCGCPVSCKCHLRLRACDRVRSCVRPVMRRRRCRWPSWRYADQAQINLTSFSLLEPRCIS